MSVPILLYDGTCGFCAKAVQFVLEREGVRRDLHFARIEGDTGKSLLARRPELATVDTVFWVEPPEGGRAEEVRVRSAVTIAVLGYLGGVWGFLGALLWLVPRPIRDWGYDFVARHRHRIAGRDVCVIPTAAQRARFLDEPGP